jgi:hypothetical protein
MERQEVSLEHTNQTRELDISIILEVQVELVMHSMFQSMGLSVEWEEWEVELEGELEEE